MSNLEKLISMPIEHLVLCLIYWSNGIYVTVSVCIPFYINNVQSLLTFLTSKKNVFYVHCVCVWGVLLRH